MRIRAPFLVMMGLLATACAEDVEAPELAEPDVELLPLDASEVVLDRRTPRPQEIRSLYRRAQRQQLAGGVAHYQFDVRVGSGKYDVVRVHRVVQERRPWRPIRTGGSVFMTHGASLTFAAVFLKAGSDNPGPGTSAAIYLAANGIDVWGMDFAWTRVPIETTDFGFMRDWGVEKDVDHTLAAMSVARVVRGLTGQGFGRIHLLGYSYGVGVAYGAAGRETQQPGRARDILGLIPVDQVMKFPDAAGRGWACGVESARQASINSGVYRDAGGIGSATIGQLAVDDPGGVSPVVPGLTNNQAAMFVGARTFALQPFPTRFWHFVAGRLDGNGMPEGLLYARPDRWARMLASLPPYMPLQARLEGAAAQCEMNDVSFDDHLAEISVPILYVGAAGAIGDVGNYTSTLTASTDVTNHLVTADRTGGATDFGHADLFLADDAPSLVWDVMRHWIIARDEVRRLRSDD